MAVAPPSMLRGKTLEEIINKWTSDLEANVREFNKFGAEVAAWDRALIENGNNVIQSMFSHQLSSLNFLKFYLQIAALYSYVLAAEKQQNEINEALNHIEQQQNDLATTLDAYEKVSQEILGGQSSTLRTLDTGPADNERDKKCVFRHLFHTNSLQLQISSYMLATDLHTHLDDLSGSLTQMIESVNTLSITARSDDSSKDPMAQITQILSSHLESLQWIDGAVREIETKASDVEKRIKESGHALPGNGSKSRAFGLNR